MRLCCAALAKGVSCVSSAPSSCVSSPSMMRSPGCSACDCSRLLAPNVGVASSEPCASIEVCWAVGPLRDSCAGLPKVKEPLSLAPERALAAGTESLEPLDSSSIDLRQWWPSPDKSPTCKAHSQIKRFASPRGMQPPLDPRL